MDILNRDELESRLARVVGRDLRRELSKLLDMLGDPPRLLNVPNEYWSNGWRDIQKDVEPILLDVFLKQSEGLMGEIGIGVDWDQVNLTASRWARQHTEDTLNQMWRVRHDALQDIENRYAGVGEAVGEFYEQGLTLGELRANLEPMYGPVRAEMIAITETTRAAVEGERAYIAQLEKDSGIHMTPVWQTENDEIVRRCPICWPKHNKEITDGQYPPAHPNCRCFVTYRLPEVDA